MRLHLTLLSGSGTAWIRASLLEELFWLPTMSGVLLLRGTNQDSRPSETVGSVNDALEKPSATSRELWVETIALVLPLL